MNLLNPVLLVVLSVAAFAAPAEDLSAADAQIRSVVAHARLAVSFAAPSAIPAAPVGPSWSMKCRALEGNYSLTATLSADRATLDNSWSGRAARRVQPVLDERCGATATPLASTLNFEVTPPHTWGEYILQLRPQDLDARAPKFTANFHECQYDGDWSSSRDVAMSCELTAP
jgi:hypothetical protein